MFIRLKKVQGNHYAYKVHNKRVRGKVKQKVKGYIGKAIIPQKTNKKDFFEVIGMDPDSYDKSLKEAVNDLVKWELFKHNIENIKLEKNSIKQDDQKIVLKINDGYLYDKTIKDIINFHAVGDDEYFIGKEFAELFIKAGIDIPKELFINLFEKMINK
jgi:hypothetical protein